MPTSNNNSTATATGSAAVLPLRKSAPNLNNLQVGNAIHFSARCSLKQLAGKQAVLTQLRTYRFGDDLQLSYVMNVAGQDRFMLTIAEDEEGHYLAISRELDASEQDRWFGRDALGFFTEPSTAKTIRCKIDLQAEGDWAAERYVKTVDWLEGSVLLSRTSSTAIGRQVRQIHYNLLVNDEGDRALEIEHEDATGESRVLVTVYRPVEDIESINDAPALPMGEPPMPAPANSNTPVRGQEPVPIEAPEEEPPLFLDTPAPPINRPDFRRLNTEPQPIHISREEVKPQPALEAILQAGMPPLPSFLTAREDHGYLSLDEVIPPDSERVRCDLRSAHTLIEAALSRGVRVRDLLREMLGLDSITNDEVMFELPLSDIDYRKLAMRYHLRPDHRDEIRRRLEQELADRLKDVAKRR